ncbi:MAG: bis(5'-nucleosyl)-tetraphosphatase (symmetrical) YqeK [Streptococcaceae bacterium]|jgi:predicted HD superfamily hydrolase involved in NAD metabolism|nr:bis(5'-nucleosyl)-tetraphosphatase (symmetrical) YqeK [Streptococcaceae bacterium]
MCEFDYQLNLIPLTRQELLSTVCEKVSKKRFKHILGVEQAAIELAKRYEVSIEKASIAALLHDYCKELSDEQFRQAIVDYRLDSELLDWNNNIWHGMVGRFIIEDVLDIHDVEILHAIEIHTTGSNQMNLLDKVLYVADYIEAGRSFPAVEAARLIAASNLDAAVAYETSQTLLHLIRQNVPIHPLTLQTYNHFCANMLV